MFHVRRCPACHPTLPPRLPPPAHAGESCSNRLVLVPLGVVYGLPEYGSSGGPHVCHDVLVYPLLVLFPHVCWNFPRM